MFKFYNYLLGLLLRFVFIQELAFGVGDLTAGKHAVTTTKGSRFKTSSSILHPSTFFQFRSIVVLCVKLHQSVVNPAGHFLTAQPLNINALKLSVFQKLCVFLAVS